MAGLIARVQPAAIADVRAAVASGVRVDEFSPITAARGANSEIGQHGRRKVTDDDDYVASVTIKAGERQNAVVPVVRNKPGKTIALAIKLVQG